MINVDCPGTLYLMELESLQLAHYRASTWSITLQPAGVACSCTFFLFDSSGRCEASQKLSERLPDGGVVRPDGGGGGC